MLRLFSAAMLTAALSCAQGPKPALSRLLDFETNRPGGAPAGWEGGPAGTIFADSETVHGGKWSARIERDAGSPNNFSTITSSIPMDFAGKTIELRGFLRTEAAGGYAGLWMREDGEKPGLAFASMQNQKLNGTTGWREYSITLPVNPAAQRLYFGVLLSGTGKAWADDLQLLVDGKAVGDVLQDFEREADHPSGVALTELTAIQIANLATLGKVWGLLKYHHPLVTSGKLKWDAELFRILPAVLGAPDRPAANAVLLTRIAALGAVDPCKKCAVLEEEALQLRPDLKWIADEALLGKELSRTLQSVYTNRPAGPKQFYIGMQPGVGNPLFEHELAYQGVPLPDAGLQLLALYRFWNIVEYWSPNRDIMNADWDRVLAEFIPKVALAKSTGDYKRALLQLIARVNDTHANLWSSLDIRPPTGSCRLPVTTRFIEDRAVVTAASVPDFQVGDIVTALDGVPVSKLTESWTPYYADSNQAARLRDMARSMTAGECGEGTVSITRDGQALEVKTKRVPVNPADRTGGTHDRPGDTFQLLSKDVAYLKLSSVKTADAARYIEAAAGTKGLIIDIRNYPSEFMVFSLGSRLIGKPTEFVRFTNGDVANPGAFHWIKTNPSLGPQEPRYAGKVIVLVDEVTQSQAEYTTMAFRAAPQTMVIGSTTAGADGNVSQIPLPGGLRTMISGIGVFYPDKTPTQRVGIVPDIVVRPTIAGIKAGRDELVEEAIRQIQGAVK